MKALALVLFFSVSLAADPKISLDQCNAEALVAVCIPKLATGFNFLKSYKIDGQNKDKVEHSYVFAKGTQYMINICANGDAVEGIVVTLLDKDRRKVATNKNNGQSITAISYPCNATGIYYIQYTFEGPESCCGSVLGFKR
jgi:hypothetical protein